MGTITNVIKTIFTASGASDTVGATERIGRSQTRLGQASAGAGRQFAAQSAGLGGLVAAYAGAAATSFALQAAFTGLSNAARSLQTVEGLTALAASSGISGKEILANTQAITKGQLSLVESAQQVNLALSAGFNTNQIEGLSEVALKASRALGRDLGDAYTRVVRGSAKMETELLDELGIYTKIEPATRAYAAAIGKSVSQLTEFERRQAFVNAVVVEGQRKFSSINTTIPTAAEKIEAFGKRIIDLGTTLGAFLAERLAPLADFFTNNLGASIGAFGLLGSLVLGRALSEIKDKINNFQKSVEAGAQSVNQRILKLTRASSERITQAQTAVAGVSLAPKGTAGIRDELKGLKEIAAQRALTTQELAKAQTVLQRRVTNLNALRAAEIQQIAAARQARTAAVQGTAAYLAAQQSLAGLSTKLNTTNSLLAATTTQLNTVTIASTSSNAAVARLFSTIVLRGGLAVAAVARLSLAMVSLGGFILSAVSIFGILASSIANAIGKGDEFNAFTKGLGNSIKEIFNPQTVKDTKNVFQGLGAGALTNIENANQQLRELDTFKFKQKKYLGITIQIEKTKEDLVKEVSSLLADISLDDGIDYAEAASTGTFWGGLVGGAFAGGLAGSAYGTIAGLPGAVVGAVGGALIGGATALFSKVGDASVEVTQESLERVKSLYSKELATIAADTNLGTTVAVTAEKALAYLEDQYGAAAKLDPVAKAYLDTQRQIVLESVKYQASVTEIAAIITATGKSADQIVKNYDFAKTATDFVSIITAKPLDAKVSFTVIDKEKLQSELDRIIDIKNVSIENIDKSSIDAIRGRLENGFSIDDLISKSTNPEIINFLQELNKQSVEVKNNFIELGNTDFVSKISATIGTINIGQSFSEAITAGEGINATLFRTTDLLIAINDGIKSGTLDLEQFSQGVGNISNALTSAERSIPALGEKIIKATSDLTIATLQGEDVAVYERILANLYAQKQNAELTVITEKEKLAVLKDQEGVLKTQLQLNKFLTDITPKERNVFDLELGILKSAASSPAEELAITIDYLNQITTKTSSARAAYDSYVESVRSTNLGDDVKAALLGATKEGTESLITGLNTGIEGVTAKIVGSQVEIKDSLNDTTATVTLLNKGIKDTGELGNRAKESISAIATEALSLAVDAMKNYISEYESIIKQVDSEIKSLTAEQRVVTIKFESDMSQIRRDIELINQEALIEQIGLQIDLSKAKVDAGAITDVEGAKQENQLRQQLLQEQGYLIGQEFVNESMAIEARRELLGVENTQSLAAIAAQAQLQRDKILSDSKNINALASIYEENISKTQTTNQAFIAGFATAGNNLTTALASVLTQGSSAFATAIRSMGAESGSVVAINTSAPQLAEIETSFSTIRNEFGTASLEAMSAVNKLQYEQEQAQKNNYENSIRLLDAEQEKVLASYDARIAAAALVGDIESYNALSRAKEAAEKGKDDEKETDKLTGRLADLKSGIQGLVESAFMSLNTLIITGEGSIGEIFGSLFRGIQEEVFKQTIATPISNMISSWLVGGLQEALNNKDIMGSPLSGVAGSAVNAVGDSLTKNTMGDAAVDSGAKALEGLGTKISSAMTGASSVINSAASTGAQVVQGAGQMLATTTQTTTGVVATANTAGATTLMSSLGPILAVLAVIAAIMAIFGGKDKGGSSSLKAAKTKTVVPSGNISSIPQMASGGLRRDRLPTLLEPGEFVMRRPAVNKLGVNNLAAMNATGKAPASAPTINIKNEGTQKEATASAPRFDGEKYVIDVIMRDLSSNGPIRRSLRGGAL